MATSLPNLRVFSCIGIHQLTHSLAIAGSNCQLRCIQISACLMGTHLRSPSSTQPPRDLVLYIFLAAAKTSCVYGRGNVRFELHLGGGIIGRADVMLDRENGTPGSIAIVDYKTSADADFAAYEFQLAICPLGRTDPEGVKSSLWKWYKTPRPSGVQGSSSLRWQKNPALPNTHRQRV